MTAPVRLGVIGCGVIGQYHMRAAVGDDLIELAAVADFRPEPRQAAADEFGVPRTYTDGLELLAATPWNMRVWRTGQSSASSGSRAFMQSSQPTRSWRYRVLRNRLTMERN